MKGNDSLFSFLVDHFLFFLDILMVMLLLAWQCHVLFYQLMSPSSKLLLWLLHLHHRHCSISLFYLIYRTLPKQRVLYKSKNTIAVDNHISIKERKRKVVPLKDAWSMCLSQNQSWCTAFFSCHHHSFSIIYLLLRITSIIIWLA